MILYLYVIWLLNILVLDCSSIKEVRDYLSKKCDNSYYIDMAIDKLIGYKYLDDDRFTKAFINDKINFTMMGDYKIRKELER